jgi:hypothetical protein
MASSWMPVSVLVVSRWGFAAAELIEAGVSDREVARRFRVSRMSANPVAAGDGRRAARASGDRGVAGCGRATCKLTEEDSGRSKPGRFARPAKTAAGDRPRRSAIRGRPADRVFPEATYPSFRMNGLAVFRGIPRSAA